MIVPMQSRPIVAVEFSGQLKAALVELPTRRELIPTFVDAAMAIATSGESERVSRLIEQDSHGSTLEPLTVAPKLKRGEKPVLAKEVMAVAEDIASKRHRRNGSEACGFRGSRGPANHRQYRKSAAAFSAYIPRCSVYWNHLHTFAVNGAGQRPEGLQPTERPELPSL